MKKPIKPEKEVTSRGFTRWVHPVMRRYLLACCDCGLVHEMQFKAIAVQAQRGNSFVYKELPEDVFRVQFRAKRAPKATKVQRAARK